MVTAFDVRVCIESGSGKIWNNVLASDFVSVLSIEVRLESMHAVKA